MKKSPLFCFLLAIFCFFFTRLSGQNVPQGINYQCIVRDSTGEPAKNETVNLLLSIRLEVPTGAVEYAEKHQAVTNDFGLVNLIIGQGEPQTPNSFSNIDWGAGAKFLTVALENAPNQPLGAVRLVSVPYALYAEKALEAENGDDWGSQTVVVGSTLQGNGATTPLEIKPNSINTFHLQDGSIQATDLAPGTIPPNPTLSITGSTLSISGGNEVQLPAGIVYNAGGGIAINGNVISNIGDPNPTDDLTTGSSAGGDLGGTLPNPTVDGLQNRPISANAPTVNQVLKWNGSQWEPATDATGGTTGGPAGGDLTGTYPNPNIASDAIGSAEILNGSITNADIAPGTTLPPSGPASGDLTGSYPSPSIAANAIGSAEIQDGSLTQADFAPGVGFPPFGAAGGDLTGTYPNPSIGQGAIGSAEILDGSISNADFAPGATLPPSGVAGGDLTGNYPNPLIAQNAIGTNEIANGSITNADFAPGATLPPSGAAGGDLTGLYPNPTIGTDAIGSTEIINGSLTNADFAPGVTFPPSGAANGDLSGNYPNPTVDALQNRPLSAAAPNLDQVLKWDGTQWRPADDATGGTGGGGSPTGSAGGDLGGTYPNPVVDGIQNRPVSSAAPTANQVLKWDGSQWEPAADGGGNPTGSAGGDLSGSYPNPTVDGLQNRPVSTAAPTVNQVLKWDGSQWEPADEAGGVGGNPTGPAGGDLAGTYPNPTVDALRNRPVSGVAPAVNEVLKWDGAQWEPASDGAGGTAHGDLSGMYPAPVVDGLQNRPVSAAAPNFNQVLKWNGSQWEPADDATGSPGTGGSPWGICNPGGTKIAFDTNPNGSNSAGIGICPPDDSTRLDIVNFANPMGIRIKAGQTASSGTFRGLFATARGASPIGAEIQAIGSQSNQGIVLRSTNTATGSSKGMDISVKNGNIVRGIDLKAENGALSNDGALIFSNSNAISNGVKIAVNAGKDATGLRIFSGVTSSNQVEEDSNAYEQNYGVYIDLKDRQGGVRNPLQVSNDVGLYVTADDLSNDYAAFFDGDVGIPHELEFLDPVNGNQWAMLIEKGATANCSGQTNHSDDDLLFTYNGSLRVLFRAFDGVPCYGSDRRLKENFGYLSAVLPQVLALNPQFYNLKKDPQKTRTLGFVAQEVQALFPELVHPVADENGEELLTLNYDGFSVLAVKAIQEQQGIIEQQKEELKKQQARLDELENEMREIKALLEKR